MDIMNVNAHIKRALSGREDRCGMEKVICKNCKRDITDTDFHKCCNILLRTNEKRKEMGGFYINGNDVYDDTVLLKPKRKGR